MNYLSKFKHQKIKNAISEALVFRTYNWIRLFDINAQNDQGCTGFEPVYLSTAEELKLRILSLSQKKE